MHSIHLPYHQFIKIIKNRCKFFSLKLRWPSSTFGESHKPQIKYIHGIMDNLLSHQLKFC